jgi:glycolate oxidase FAD binding subunit
VGGTIAAGFSGPRRAAAGAARDAVLGCEIINGFGEHLAFGGQVMKNVAGYDIARLMVGALGTLGVITQVSMKVIPRPVAERTLVLELPQRRAIESMNKWAGLPLPVSATCHNGDKLYVRLSGARSGVDSAANKIGGETLEDASFWEALREQRHPFFRQATSLWRVALPPASPPLELTGRALVEWNGGLRWLATDDPPGQVRSAAAAAGGHATWFRGHDGLDVFHPLDEGRLALHRNLKRAFDPAGILNRGRMYPETI